MLRLAVFGASGRMGSAVIRAAANSGNAEICGALTEPGHDLIGADAGEAAGISSLGVKVTDDPSQAIAHADIAIDFTLPAAVSGNLAACLAKGCAMVIGTTGLSASQLEALGEAAKSIGIVYGRNMSVGVNVFTALARQATRLLGPDWDAEITEAHHRHKLDSPSGTALQIGEAVAAERGVQLDDVAVYDRQGSTSERKPGAIGFSSLRAGSLVGEHSLLLASDTEVLELRHRALDRSVFADGALRAAGWLAEQSAGLYSMQDVLGIED